jgi:transcriptional regulator with XRE-family HTH domain
MVETRTITAREEEASPRGLYSNGFSQVFSDLLKKTGVACYQISKYAHLDQAYLSRLRNGEKNNPSPETVMKISLALAHLSNKFNLYDVETLFNSVGRSISIRD